MNSYQFMLKIDLLSTLATRFAIIFAGLLTSILTARHLGPAGRGNYFFVITFATVIAQFSNFGLQSSNTYLIAQHEDLAGKLVINSLWVSLILGTLFTACAIFTLYLMHQPLKDGVWLSLILVPSTIFYLLGTNLLIGLNKIQIYNFFQLGSSVLIVISLVVASTLKLNSEGFIATSTVTWLLTAIILFITLAYKTKYSFRFDQKTFYLGSKYALKVYITSLLALLILKGNVFILKCYSNNETLGYFSVASQIIDILIILPTSVGMLLFPNLIRNSESRWEQTKYSLSGICFFMFIACAATILLIKPFIHIAFGTRFDPAIPILIWMLPGAFFLGATSIISQYLASLDYPKELILIWTGAFLILCCLSLFLIPRFSAIGAGVAQSITYCVIFILIFRLSIKKHNLLKINSAIESIASR